MCTQSPPTKQPARLKRKDTLAPPPGDVLKTFRNELFAKLEKNLPKILEQNNDDELCERSDYYGELASTFRQGQPIAFLLGYRHKHGVIPEFRFDVVVKNKTPVFVQHLAERSQSDFVRLAALAKLAEKMIAVEALLSE